MYKEKERLSYITDFYKKINLQKCTRAFLKNLVQTQKALLFADPEFHMKITECLTTNAKSKAKVNPKQNTQAKVTSTLKAETLPGIGEWKLDSVQTQRVQAAVTPHGASSGSVTKISNETPKPKSRPLPEKALNVNPKKIKHDGDFHEPRVHASTSCMSKSNTSASQANPDIKPGEIKINEKSVKTELSIQAYEAIPDVKTHADRISSKIKLLLLGGQNQCSGSEDKSYRLDLMNGESDVFDSSSMLQHAAVCHTQLGIFVAGGIDKFNIHSTNCHLLSADTLKWKIFGSLPTPVYGASAACIDKKVFLIGDALERADKMVILDLSTRKLTTAPNLLQMVKFPLVCTAGNLILVLFNTIIENTHVEYMQDKRITLQAYDTNKKQWYFRSPLPEVVTNTCGTSVCSVGNRFFVMGGVQRLLLCYNINDDVWTKLKPPTKQHFNGFAVAHGSELFLCGGQHDESVTDKIERYDIATGDWQFLHVKLTCPMTHAFCCKIK